MRKTEKIPEFMLIEDDEPHYGKTWRHLIWKIYEVDPLRCPECGDKLELVNIVFEKKDIKKILARLYSTRKWFANSRPPP